jgi:hypothetical protein
MMRTRRGSRGGQFHRSEQNDDAEALEALSRGARVKPFLAIRMGDIRMARDR